MSRQTRESRSWSSESGSPLHVAPDRSRLLAAWWLGVHGLAAAGLALSGLPVWVKLGGAAAAFLHALLCSPGPPPDALLLFPDGTWALRRRGAEDFVPAHGAESGPFWIVLRLASDAEAGARTTTVLLLRDQMPAADWRALCAAVGRARPLAE